MSSDPSGGWLLRPPVPDAAARLFCLPYLGAGASMYHQWPQFIDGTEVCPIQLPGREGRLGEAPLGTYEEQAGAMIDALAPWLDRPYALIAHCNIAFLLYELAVQLYAAGRRAPAQLFVSSMVAPHQAPFGSILDAPDDEMAGQIAIFLRARGMEPIPEIVELSVDAMIADLHAYRAYRPTVTRWLDCPVTVFAWDSDERVPPALTTQWDRYGTVRHVTLAGDHWTYLRGPDALVDEVAHDLARATSMAVTA